MEMPNNLANGFAPKNVTVLTIKDSRTQIWSYESEYKGRTRFHIREVYLDMDENWAPGKAGLSVPVDQAGKFCATIGAIATPKPAAQTAVA